MNALRLPLTLCATLVVFAGCGGSQPPISAPDAIPQGGAITPYAAKRQDLVYVLSPASVFVLSYDSGAILETFANPGARWGVCSDASGNVFIPVKDKVLEYKHGGTEPIAMLENPGEYSLGCTVDPLTGNLAVTNYSPSGSGPKNNVAIYQAATGSPTLLTDASMKSYYSCTYDSSGNLIIDGEEQSGGDNQFAELPRGLQTFEDLTSNESLNPGQLQWDGQYLVMNDGGRGVYQISISGSSATVVHKITLHSRVGLHLTFSLQDATILSPTGPDHNTVGLWRYPRGGKLIKRYFVMKKASLGAITVSLAPRR